MNSDTAITEALRASGHKPTVQRLVVAAVLSETGAHLTVTQVLERVRRRSPSLQYLRRATVSRALTLLSEMGLVAEGDIGIGALVYEWVRGDPHPHLGCRRCGSIQHPDGIVFNSAIQTIQPHYRFRARVTHLALFGSRERCVSSTAEQRPEARQQTLSRSCTA